MSPCIGDLVTIDTSPGSDHVLVVIGHRLTISNEPTTGSDRLQPALIFFHREASETVL